VECQDADLVDRELEGVRNIGGGNFISEPASVQLDMTEEVLVTVTGCGVVTVWDRRTGSQRYRGHHHGYEPVLGVKVLGDLIVTGAIQGSLAVLTVGVEAVVLEAVVEEQGQSSINHLDVEGERVLVGTDRDMRLWDVHHRKKPKLVTTVPAKHVCCCVLFYPHAACTGLVLRQGLQVWYGVVWCGRVWYGMVWYSMVWKSRVGYVAWPGAKVVSRSGTWRRGSW